MPKVLIVDDSALMRKYLKSILDTAGFETDFARNGKECLEKLTIFNPDVITLDINMPVMDGITCLSKIMKTTPKPVVMVSSLTKKGAQATFEALELGAVDYVQKPSGSVSHNMSESADILVEKVKSAVNMRVDKSMSFKNKMRMRQEKAEALAKNTVARQFTPQHKSKKDLVVIGVSTGGPGCLQEILQSLPKNFPLPIVIAQHMPARFTEVFSQRLDKICKLKVQEVTGPLPLEAGNIYIAKGDADAEIIQRGSQLMVTSVSADKSYLWHPSVSKLVTSALSHISADKLICVQLTGMGNDGADSMTIAHKQGATTIAESKETAVVYGMPKELVAAGAATLEIPNYQIANAIMDAIQ